MERHDIEGNIKLKGFMEISRRMVYFNTPGNNKKGGQNPFCERRRGLKF